jgi:hypothetical protein
MNINIVAMAYLYIPLLIFVCGWTNIICALLVCICTIGAIGLTIKKYKWNSEKLFFNGIEIIVVLVFFVCVCVVGGCGDLFLQDGDWNWRHAFLADLVNYKWPVIYDGNIMFTYCIGQFIVPALIGKIFKSYTLAIWTLTIWNAVGLLIAYIISCKFLRTDKLWKKILVLLFFVLWSGATNLGSDIYDSVVNDVGLCSYKWIDLNRVRVHFASNFDSLRSAFQHVIVPWICCSIFMSEKDHYGIYVLLAVPMLFSASFGFVYFVGILLVYFIFQSIRSGWRKNIACAVSVENILVLPLTFVLCVYLLGNVLGDKPETVGFDLINMFTRLDFYVIFILVEFIGYAIFLCSKNKNNILFWIILLELLFIPFVSYGMFNDLCSRGSIPARFILMLMCLEQIIEYKWKNRFNIGIMIIFLIGSINVMQEAASVIGCSFEKGIGNEKLIYNDLQTLNGVGGNPNLRADQAYNYYTFEYDKSLFYKISKKD